MTTTDSSTSIISSDLTRRGAITAALAVVVNVVIVLGVRTTGAVQPFAHLAYARVSLFTVLGVVGATLVYGLIRRRRERPDRDFAVVASVVLVLSWIPDLTFIPTVPGSTTGGVATLMALHATTAAICYGILTRGG